jgi:hypothetical protein
MKRTAILTGVILLFGLAQCERFDCWGGTEESKDKEYKGKASAELPYHAVEKDLWVIHGKETGSFFTTVTIWLHNPMDMPQKTDVTCKLVRNSAGAPGVIETHTAGKNTRKDVTVKPKASKRVRLQFNLNFDPRNHGYEAECTTSFVIP